MPFLSKPELAFFADISARVGPAHEVGRTPQGNRRIIPILAGEVQGDGWKARLLPGGADFQMIVSATMAHLDARYVMETDAGDLIFVKNQAIRAASAEAMARLIKGEAVDPAAVYFRCVPSFETSSPSLSWINERLFIGTGLRRPDDVQISCFLVK